MSGPKSRWTRRRTVIGGQSRADDWIISYNGEDVGRVLTDVAHNGSEKWKWASWRLPGRTGREETLEAACDSLRRTILDLEA